MTKRPEHGVGAHPLLRMVPALALALAAAGPCLAQTVTVIPTFDTSLTWTDNGGNDGSGGGAQDWIFELAPGITVSRESGRLNGNFNARLRNLAYANDSDRSTSFLALRGSGEFEAVERLLFIDASAGITRSNLSVFTGRAASDELNVGNESETRIWSIAPRLEFQLGQQARGTIVYLNRWIDSGSAAGLNDQYLQRLSAQLADPTALGRFGWGLDYVRSDTRWKEDVSRDRNSEIGRATLFINLSSQLRLRAIAGRESNDFQSRNGQSSGVYGAGVDWNPTERTEVAATVEDRIFGRGYDVSLSHRTRRATWFASASRDISSTANTLGQVAFLEQDCFELVTDPDFRPEVTDPIERTGFLAECLEFATLRTNSDFVQRALRAGVSVRGVRNVLSFSVVRTDRLRLSDLLGSPFLGDFAESDRIRTTAATLALDHRLSGLSSLTASLTRSTAEALEEGGSETRRLLASVGVTTRLGPRTQGSLRYRYQRADGRERDFTENAITASLGMRF